MVITLNNRKEDIPDRERLSVQELLDLKRFTFKFLVVRINGKPVKPDDYEAAMIQDGDEVMVLHLISGG